ncbi:MAG: hypothetical protein AAF657_18145 [Acidobacteriota bacterium]
MVERGLSRLILLIASQWPAGGPGRELAFIPAADWQPGQSLTPTQRLPVDLYEQFLDPDAGACDPVTGLDEIPGISLLESESSLVVNPTLGVAQKVLNHAFVQASERERVLVMHFIGHGLEDRPADNAGMHHRLLLIDSADQPQTDLDAWNPYVEARQHLTSKHPPGFVLLVDACQASRARPEITPWGETPSTYVWMGASQDTAAFDGCFSWTLLNVMREGDLTRTGPRPTPELHSRHLRPLIDQHCHRPEEGKRPEADDITSKADDYVFITRNRAVGTNEADLGLAEATTRDRLRSAIGEHYQVIDVDGVNDAMAHDPFVVLTGGAGSGKTSLAAVLRDPPHDLDVRRVDAVTFLETSSDLDTIAAALYPQLATNLQYADRQGRFEQSVAEPEQLGAHQRYISGPLEQLSQFDSLIVCLDGLDQLVVERQGPILDEYRRLVDETDGRFRVLATSRPESAGGPIPADAAQVAMPALDDRLARRYLTARGLADRSDQDRILSLDEGHPNWLVLTLAADQLSSGGAELSSDTSELYRDILAAASADLGAPAVEAIIDVLAAAGEVAGVGPRLPFAIFGPAVAKLGGPAGLGDINSVLGHQRLYRIIERSNPATDQEHLGLFHLTAVESLRPTDDRRRAAHLAIAEVLDESLESGDV